MPKTDPISMLMDAGINGYTNFSNDIRSNLNISERPPGERGFVRSARSFSGALNEISPITNTMNVLKGEKPSLPTPPKVGGGEQGIKGLFGMFAAPGDQQTFPTPPEPPQFVKNMQKQFKLPPLPGQSQGSRGSKSMQQTSSNKKRATSNDQSRNRKQEKNWFELEPY